jgi:hypothetical protein
VQAHYVEQLARRLGLQPGLVQSEMRRASIVSPAARAAAIAPPPATVTKKLSSEDHLIALLLFHRSLVMDIIRGVSHEDVTDSRNQQILSIISDPSIPDLEPIQIIAGMDDTLADHAERLIGLLEGKPALLPGAVRKEAEWALYRVRLERLRFLQREVTADVREAQKSGDREAEVALMAQLNELADLEKHHYPPPSPYFRDSRTGDAARR